jgi:hypothetical protein
MGWHYILTFKCTILPEFIPFIANNYLDTLYDEDRDFHYKVQPYRHYDSDDERSIEEKERIALIEKEREEQREQREKDYELLPKSYKDLIDIWTSLDIGNHFYEYSLNSSEFNCEISKKVNSHSGDLHEDYLTFLNDIIVPITSEIMECQIHSDDYGDLTWYYSDSELRNVRFCLEDKIKNIEHTYNEDKTEILETRVIYKHSIKKKQFLDLNRSYGLK